MPPRFSKEWPVAAISMLGSLRQERTSPCEDACPAGNNIQQLHSCLARGDADAALHSIIAKNPFPGVTGRVCPHPCEERCNRCGYDEGVAIHSLERHAADHGTCPALRPLPDTGRRVAVIGAGPAGLTAARFLRQAGHAVTVYESSPVMGGLMRHSIPDFRLPKDVVDRETGAIAAIGVKVVTNVCVGRDIALRDILDSFDACVVAVGLWKERLLDIQGREFLHPAVSWMKSTTLERASLKGQRVAILGGGGVAFDCAFTARRLGADEVCLISLEAGDQLHAPAAEIQQARDERVVLRTGFSTRSVTRLDNGGYVIAAQPITGFSFDAEGELHIEAAAAPAAEFVCDLVICASGLKPDLSLLRGVDVATTPRGLIALDPATGMSSVPGLFAAGDIATGPSLVSSAIGHGRRTAFAVHAWLTAAAQGGNIDAWLTNEGVLAMQARPAHVPPRVVPLEDIMHVDYHPHAPRQTPAPDRSGPGLAFDEVEGGFTPRQAVDEASRCLHCGHCIGCGSCVESCPGHILDMGDDGPYVAYPEECWHCGCCRIACSCGAVSYRFPINMMV